STRLRIWGSEVRILSGAPSGLGSILVTWFTFYSGEMVDTFSAVNAFGLGSPRLPPRRGPVLPDYSASIHAVTAAFTSSLRSSMIQCPAPLHASTFDFGCENHGCMRLAWAGSRHKW